MSPLNATPRPAADRIRVLYVDDDLDCLASMAACLEAHGFAVTRADHPTDAEAVLAAGEFDVVLSDIRMPGNCRLEWIERLQRPGTPPVVLITGNPEFETAVRAVNLSVSAYLLKPPDIPELVETLQRVGTMQRRHIALAILSDEIRQFLSTEDPTIRDQPGLCEKLQALLRALSAEARLSVRSPCEQPSDLRWRSAIGDVIDVLEQTKHSFRSRELGALRSRLNALLASAGSTAANAM